MTDPKTAARLLGRYAKPYAQGAFATPTAKDIQDAMAHGRWHEWPDGVYGVSRRLTRDSNRKDWTGRSYTLPQGSRVITFLAAEATAKLPDFDAFSRVYAYAEDDNITHQMISQGREVYAVQITAASNIINCWGRAGSKFLYRPHDLATLARLPVELPESMLSRAAQEARALTGWYDDFPFYSDGSWDALSLRGFNPDDPTWGVKPSEMSKAWWKANPGAGKYSRCQWTRLAEACPAATQIAQFAGNWGELERVRFLRMRAKDGEGTLSRHTDITDKASGTRDGQIVRFHIPLVTGPKAVMHAWNLRGEQITAHLSFGHVWYLDARKPHAVTNGTGKDRIHLVIDVKSTARCRSLISDGVDVAALWISYTWSGRPAPANPPSWPSSSATSTA